MKLVFVRARIGRPDPHIALHGDDPALGGLNRLRGEEIGRLSCGGTGREGGEEGKGWGSAHSSSVSRLHPAVVASNGRKVKHPLRLWFRYRDARDEREPRTFGEPSG